MNIKRRPRGVTIVSVLMIIIGTLLVIGGIGFMAAVYVVTQNTSDDKFTTFNGNVIPGINDTNNYVFRTNESVLQFVGIIMFTVGGILTTSGIVCFIVAWGLLEGKSWAWITTIILSIISIIVDVIFVSMSIEGGLFIRVGIISVSLIIDGVIIWYLYRPNVKLYFGRIKA